MPSDSDTTNGKIPILTDIVERGNKAPDPGDEDITQPRFHDNAPESDHVEQEETRAADYEAELPKDFLSDIQLEPDSEQPEEEISDLTRQIEGYLSTDIAPLIDQAMEKNMQNTLLNLKPVLEESVREAMKNALQDILVELKNNKDNQ